MDDIRIDNIRTYILNDDVDSLKREIEKGLDLTQLYENRDTIDVFAARNRSHKCLKLIINEYNRINCDKT